MSHPLSHLSVDISSVVTCGCNELDERYDGKNVLMAGMIAGIRTINTKKGDPMAFVQLEDMGGQVEVVVFPRTFAEVKEILIPDAVVLVKGKAQTREGQTSVLADAFQNYVDQIISVGPDPQWQRPLLDVAPTINGVRGGEPAETTEDEDASMEPSGNGVYASGSFGSADDDDFLSPDENPFRNEPPSWMRDQIQASPKTQSASPDGEPSTPRRVEEAAPDNPYLHESRSLRDEDNDVTPVPVGMDADALLPDETASPPPRVAEEETAPDNPYLHESRNLRDEELDVTPIPQHLRDDPAFQVDASPQPPAPVTSEPVASVPSNGQDEEHTNGHANGNTNGHANGSAKKAATGKGSNGNSARTLEIVFRPSGDLDRDKYRLKEIVEAVRDPRGRDRFVVLVKSGRKQTTLAFPNDPCSISDRLRQQLSKFFRVEINVAE